MTIKQRYDELSKAPVSLNEEHHIYIDNETGKFYNSVTGVLYLITDEFNADSVIEGLIRQYKGFRQWYYEIHGPESEFIENLSLYVNYKQFAPWEWRTWDGEAYKAPLKKLSMYDSLKDFKTDYMFYAATNSVERKKNIYYFDDIMSAAQIKQMWQDMTDIANHYGNIVHLTLERYFLKVQGFLDAANDYLLAQTTEHYFWIKNNYPKFIEKYYNSVHSFEEYEINENLFDLMHHIETEFKKAQIEMGRCIVPEKRLLYKALAGTKDVHVDIDDNYFITGDHKTNKNLSFESPYGTKMKAPFDGYDDCEMNKYTFQLSIYSYICERLMNKKAKELYITYYSRKKNVFRVFPIEYKKDEAEYLIDLYVSWIEQRKERYYASSLGPYIKQNIKEQWIDHFAKNFYYLIAKNKDKDKKFFVDYIDEYKKTYQNLN